MRNPGLQELPRSVDRPDVKSQTDRLEADWRQTGNQRVNGPQFGTELFIDAVNIGRVTEPFSIIQYLIVLIEYSFSLSLRQHVACVREY